MSTHAPPTPISSHAEQVNNCWAKDGYKLKVTAKMNENEVHLHLSKERLSLFTISSVSQFVSWIVHIDIDCHTAQSINCHEGREDSSSVCFHLCKVLSLGSTPNLKPGLLILLVV